MVDRAELIVLVVNIILGFSCAFPLARRLSRLKHSRWGFAGSYLMLIIMYLTESIGFMAGMATNIPGILLALVWGAIFGSWIRRSGGTLKSVLRSAVLVSLFSSLPAVSMLSVPVVMWFGGWTIFSSDSGVRFGVPDFIPWPMNTILGFCILIAIVGVFFKSLITTGIVYLTYRSNKRVKPKGNEREINHQTI